MFYLNFDVTQNKTEPNETKKKKKEKTSEKTWNEHWHRRPQSIAVVDELVNLSAKLR